MVCLWDTSKKGAGNMNFYDKENDRWYDEKIGDFFIKISKGENIKPTEYYILSNQETVYSTNSNGHMVINIGKKKAKRVVFNVSVRRTEYYNVGFGIVSEDKNGNLVGESVIGNEGREQDDGTITFFIDIKDKDYNKIIEVQKWWGQEFTTFKYFSLIYEKEYVVLNYNEYKKAISNYI
jgi:hypothetical protein